MLLYINLYEEVEVCNPTYSLTPGTHVTTSKNDINYVVTEYGVAQLRGKSMKQRTLELIGIAHPNFRAELTEQAKRMRIL